MSAPSEWTRIESNDFPEVFTLPGSPDEVGAQLRKVIGAGAILVVSNPDDPGHQILVNFGLVTRVVLTAVDLASEQQQGGVGESAPPNGYMTEWPS